MFEKKIQKKTVFQSVAYSGKSDIDTLLVKWNTHSV